MTSERMFGYKESAAIGVFIAAGVLYYAALPYVYWMYYDWEDIALAMGGGAAGGLVLRGVVDLAIAAFRREE